MPVKVKAAKGGGYDIVEVASGKVVGHSETVGKARASAQYRNNATASKQTKNAKSNTSKTETSKPKKRMIWKPRPSSEGSDIKDIRRPDRAKRYGEKKRHTAARKIIKTVFPKGPLGTKSTRSATGGIDKKPWHGEGRIKKPRKIVNAGIRKAKKKS